MSLSKNIEQMKMKKKELARSIFNASDAISESRHFFDMKNVKYINLDSYNFDLSSMKEIASLVDSVESGDSFIIPREDSVVIVIVNMYDVFNAIVKMVCKVSGQELKVNCIVSKKVIEDKIGCYVKETGTFFLADKDDLIKYL